MGKKYSKWIDSHMRFIGKPPGKFKDKKILILFYSGALARLRRRRC